ncbi:hypothetical protein HK097_009264 [Rhizophlyctis rosea]|uniref:RRM domain-containing protein n=1 Tax=Rhizophlyctis rosea TaxID=64517 RepID=A0AAD5SLR0_9FUNG|nr:hypothetical protein HK097_009264 [Rhizophlyctis rosea]
MQDYNAGNQFRHRNVNAGSSRVVFVGNIPYDLTEPQLIDIFKEVGPVVSFRLLFDRDTGKPKGFGFCTFQDAETAASAVRNLNGYDVGGRQLRIDFAESDKEDGPADRNRPDDQPRRRDQAPPVQPPQAQQQQPQVHQPPQQQVLPPQQPQATMQPQQSSVEVIGKTLASYTKAQMMELVSSLKLSVQTNPDVVRSLLTDNPQLTYAVFQALLVMNLVEPAAMQRILQSQAMNAQQSSMQARPPQVPVIPQQIPAVNPALMATPQMLPAAAPVAQMPTQAFVRPLTQQMPTQAQTPITPQLQPQLQQPHLTEMVQEQQKQLLLQVLSLTPEQINAMPPGQRNQILALRAQVLGGQQ